MRDKGKKQQQRHFGTPSGLWLYGLHAVRAALANKDRKAIRAVLTERAVSEIGQGLLGRIRYEIAKADAVARNVPSGAVHQGAALLCEPLRKRALEDVLASRTGVKQIVLVLDQISDPQNTGAILRSAAAFGAAAVVVQERHAPAESGALAKAASGALDTIAYVEVVNISRALDELSKLGFWRVALTGDGDQPLNEAKSDGAMALVLGSEGSGIRRLVREHCDTSAYIPFGTGMESLNVSNAAAVALYELRRS